MLRPLGSSTRALVVLRALQAAPGSCPAAYAPEDTGHTPPQGEQEHNAEATRKKQRAAALGTGTKNRNYIELSVRSAECGVRSVECGCGVRSASAECAVRSAECRSAQCAVRSAECGVRSAQCGVRQCGVRSAGVRSAECGVRSAECGVRVRSAECAVRSAECGVRSAECGVRQCAVRSAECGVRVRCLSRSLGDHVRFFSSQGRNAGKLVLALRCGVSSPELVPHSETQCASSTASTHRASRWSIGDERAGGRKLWWYFYYNVYTLNGVLYLGVELDRRGRRRAGARACRSRRATRPSPAPRDPSHPPLLSPPPSLPWATNLRQRRAPVVRVAQDGKAGGRVHCAGPRRTGGRQSAPNPPPVPPRWPQRPGDLVGELEGRGHGLELGGAPHVIEDGEEHGIEDALPEGGGEHVAVEAKGVKEDLQG